MLDLYDEGAADARWRLCVYATDRLLAHAGLDIQQRRNWAKSGAASYRSEYPNAPDLDPGIGQRWRQERADVTTLLDDTRATRTNRRAKRSGRDPNSWRRCSRSWRTVAGAVN